MKTGIDRSTLYDMVRTFINADKSEAFATRLFDLIEEENMNVVDTTAALAAVLGFFAADYVSSEDYLYIAGRLIEDSASFIISQDA